MLSYLVPPLLPHSVSDLFSPSLDASKLHLSLTSGQVELAHLSLNTERINSQFLSPVSGIHIRRGSILQLSVELDWKHLFSQPILVRAKGVHLVLTHNQLLEDAKVAAATKGSATNIPTAEETKDAQGACKQVESGAPTLSAEEVYLLEAAIAYKLSVLQQHEHPNSLHFASKSVFDLSGFTLGGMTKGILSMASRSIHVQVKEITIEYEHEDEEEEGEQVTAISTASEGTKSRAVSPTGVPSTRTSTPDEMKDTRTYSSELDEVEPEVSSASVSKEESEIRSHLAEMKISSNSTHLGINVDSFTIESFRSSAEQLGLSPTMSLIKDIRIDGLSVWLDQPSHDSKHIAIDDVAIGTSQPNWSTEVNKVVDTGEEKRGSLEEGSITTVAPPVAKHSYLLSPTSSSIHLAANSHFDTSLESIIKFLMQPEIMTNIQSQQFALLYNLLVSLQRRMNAACVRLEAVAKEHFRAPTDAEHQVYMRAYDAVMKEEKIESTLSSECHRIEREVSFYDVIAMRCEASSRLHAKEQEAQAISLAAGTPFTANPKLPTPLASTTPWIRQPSVNAPSSHGETVLTSSKSDIGFWQLIWRQLGLEQDAETNTVAIEKPQAEEDHRKATEATALTVDLTSAISKDVEIKSPATANQ